MRQRIGNPLAGEAGADRPLQQFENGFMIYLTERNSAISADQDGQWMVWP